MPVVVAADSDVVEGSELPPSCEPLGDASSNLFSLTAPLKLNSRYLGDVIVEVNQTGQGNIEAAGFLELVLPLLSRERAQAMQVVVGNREKVPLSELCISSPSAIFSIDNIEVHVSATVTDLSLQRIGVSARLAPDPEDFEPGEKFSAGLGFTSLYSRYLESDLESPDALTLGELNGFFNFGAFSGTGLLYQIDFDNRRDREFRRDEIRFLKDFYESSLRLQVGDINTLQRSFQRSPQLAGVSFGRRYGIIQPFKNVQSRGTRSLDFDRDSIVEIQINGQTIEELTLSAGRYEISDFPLVVGSNDIQLLVTDDLGREEIIDLDVFSQSSLLGEDVTDFGFTLGVPRTPTDTGFHYSSEPVATGYFRFAADDRLTIGFNSQVKRQRFQYGAEMLIGTDNGVVGIELANSRIWNSDDSLEDDPSGNALGLSYSHRFKNAVLPFSVNTSLRSISRYFVGVEDGLPRNRKLLSQLSIRTRLSNGTSISGSYTDLHSHDDTPRSRRLSLSLGRSWRRVAVSANASQSRLHGEDDDYQLGVNITVRLGRSQSISSRFNSEQNALSMEARYLGGVGLNSVQSRVGISKSDTTRGALVEANLIHNRFEGQVNLDKIEVSDEFGERSESLLRLRLNSFLGYTDGKLAIGRDYGEGFIIADAHESIKDATIEIRQQGVDKPLAKSGWLGPALLPLSRAYYPRKLEFGANPIPLGYDLGHDVIDVMPGVGQAYQYTLGSAESKSILGRVQDVDGKPVALLIGYIESRDAESADGRREIFTNSTGRFVVDKLATGQYRLVFEGLGSAVVAVPENAEGFIDVGTISIE